MYFQPFIIVSVFSCDFTEEFECEDELLSS
jgi:hypothetical protein